MRHASVSFGGFSRHHTSLNEQTTPPMPCRAAPGIRRWQAQPGPEVLTVVLLAGVTRCSWFIPRVPRSRRSPVLRDVGTACLGLETSSWLTTSQSCRLSVGQRWLRRAASPALGRDHAGLGFRYACHESSGSAVGRGLGDLHARCRRLRVRGTRRREPSVAIGDRSVLDATRHRGLLKRHLGRCHPIPAAASMEVPDQIRMIGCHSLIPTP